jgi:hypothetical protein
MGDHAWLIVACSGMGSVWAAGVVSVFLMTSGLRGAVMERGGPGVSGWHCDGSGRLQPARTKATANTGILRCAQDDDFPGLGS